MSVQQKKMSNKAQIQYLCQYMAQDPAFAAGDFKTPQGYGAPVANAESGTRRARPRQCWRDQKRKARVESGATTRAINATGNSLEVPELSENAALVLITIGVEMAAGFGPDESPIGNIVPEAVSTAVSENRAQSLPTRAVVGGPPTARKSRVRKANPPDRFIKAQNENNMLLREILAELRRSNRLREEQNNIM